MDWFRRTFRRDASSRTGDAIQVPTGTPGPNASDVRAGLPAAVLQLERQAFLPTTVEEAFGAGSGFGGQPFLAEGVEHPACPRCHEPMQLIVQLAIAEAPIPIGGEGLLQLFYCDTDRDNDLCEVQLEGWEPFSTAHVQRLVPAGPGGAPSNAGTPYPARRVTDWRPVRDLPNWEETRWRGIELTDAEADQMADGKLPWPGEKVGGWPDWVQGVEYPSCPECGTVMDLLVQIDSEQNVPRMWGDVGVGHITQCPNHPDRLGFGWACA